METKKRQTSWAAGLDAAKDAAEEKRRQVLASVAERNNCLLSDRRFREFLAILADGGRVLDPSSDCGEYERGRRDALRDVVLGIVRRSDGGAAWLAEYAEGRREL